MAQTFSPLRHRHSFLPEVVREHFSNVAAFLYVLLECGHQACFTGSSPDLEKYLVGIYIMRYALLLVWKSLDFLSILNLFFSLSVLPVLLFVLVITIVAKLSPDAFCCLLYCFFYRLVHHIGFTALTWHCISIINLSHFFLPLSYVLGSCA